MNMKLNELKCKSVNNNLDEYLEYYDMVMDNMERKEFIGYFNKEDMQTILKDGAKLFVYRNNKEIVCSFVYIPACEHSMKKLNLNYDIKDVGECGPLLVNPKYRGNGLQYQMLQVLTKYCKKLGKKYLITTVHPDNVYSINNFLKEGYKLRNKFVFHRGPRNLYVKYLEKKIIFLEGLPGVGKTTILNELMKRGENVVAELVNNPTTEEDFLENDLLKIKKFNEGKIFIDRGIISTLSYSQVKKIINPDYNINKCLRWFKKVRKYLNNSEIVYLTNKGTDYYVSVKDINSPYGSLESQKMLECISLYNAQKYCKSIKIIEYHKDNMEEVVDEIIN